jgi:hypothetical protein
MGKSKVIISKYLESLLVEERKMVLVYEQEIKQLNAN